MKMEKRIYLKPFICFVNFEDNMYSPDAVSGEELPSDPQYPAVQNSNEYQWGEVWKIDEDIE